jgi:hypothetical protein
MSMDEPAVAPPPKQQPPPKPQPPPQPRRLRTFAISLVLIVLAFLGGYVPKEIEARRVRATLSKTELNLRMADLHRQLGVASHEAQRNNFAAAANEARAFFDGCASLAASEQFNDQPRTKNAISAYAASRDTILAQLAAGDPTAKERLAGLYLAMEGVLERRL